MGVGVRCTAHWGRRIRGIQRLSEGACVTACIMLGAGGRSRLKHNKINHQPHTGLIGRLHTIPHHPKTLFYHNDSVLATLLESSNRRLTQPI